MKVLIAALAAVAAGVVAQAQAQLTAREIVTLPTRPGVTQSFFLAGMGEVKPLAAALLFIGGGGSIRLRMEDGQVRFGAQNFLPRSRLEFIRNGILPVIMDNPSDQQGGAGMSDDFRVGREHLADVRAVVAEVKRRHPALPVFLVGTSRSTISVAYLGQEMAGAVDGIVLSSSLWRTQHPGSLQWFDWRRLKLPTLIVHHREDGCRATLYHDMPSGAAKLPLISVKGGKPPESGPCDPLAAHGFFGKEAETVDAIAAWMLKKPYRNDID
jgi:alpha/beta superfamily hydrolase